MRNMCTKKCSFGRQLLRALRDLVGRGYSQPCGNACVSVEASIFKGCGARNFICGLPYLPLLGGGLDAILGFLPPGDDCIAASLSGWTAGWLDKFGAKGILLNIGTTETGGNAHERRRN